MLEIGMQTFELRFAGDGIGEGKTIKFESKDGSEAFSILRDERAHRHVSLWKGDKHLATLVRRQDDLWVLD